MRKTPTTLTIVDKDCEVPSLLENHIQHKLNIQYIRIYVDYQYMWYEHVIFYIKTLKNTIDTTHATIRIFNIY